MKKKNLLWTMAAAFALASCSETELVEMPPQAQEQNAIAFSTYLGDNAQSRAVVMDEKLLEVEGFGVNAYYTGQNPFSSEETYSGNAIFMQNTKVTYDKDKGVWTYSPVKYWPNNTGDMVSFFAYGPYTKTVGTENITEIDGTNINFTVASEVKEQVDFIYSNQTGDYCTINKKKQTVNERIHFKFDHALARIAFTVEAAVDEVANGNNLLDGNTRINVKKVVLMENSETADPQSPTGPFYKIGTFDLYEGTWEEAASDADTQGFTFDGGRVDGDGSDNEFYHTVEDLDADAEDTNTKINVVQLTRFNASEPQRLLNDSSYLMVIPQTTAFKIYIEYDVISGGYENNTEGGEGTLYDQSAITNKITKEIKSITFEKGMAYNFNLVLGMTSVKFEVDKVTAWDEPQPGDDEWIDEDLPVNLGAFALNRTAADMNVDETLEITEQKAASRSVSTLVLTTEDEQIVGIEENTIKALSPGMATVTVTRQEDNATATVTINVLPTAAETTLENPISVVKIDKGDFWMGLNYNDVYDGKDNPWYQTSVDKDFYLGQYEVTVAQFVEFLNTNKDNLSNGNGYDDGHGHHDVQTIQYNYPTASVEDEAQTEALCELEANGISGTIGNLTVDEDHKNLPVKCSWLGAYLFANSVGGYLPSEKEWEYAARGKGDEQSRPVWWINKFEEYDADTHDLSIPQTDDEDFVVSTTARFFAYENLPIIIENEDTGDTEFALRATSEMVDDEEADEIYHNGWGLYDLFGNLQEWCGNYSYVYGSEEKELIVNSNDHVVRGFIPEILIRSTDIYLREFHGVAYRNMNTSMNETGFRVAFASDYSGSNWNVQTVSNDTEE